MFDGSHIVQVYVQVHGHVHVCYWCAFRLQGPPHLGWSVDTVQLEHLPSRSWHSIGVKLSEKSETNYYYCKPPSSGKYMISSPGCSSLCTLQRPPLDSTAYVTSQQLHRKEGRREREMIIDMTLWLVSQLVINIFIYLQEGEGVVGAVGSAEHRKKEKKLKQWKQKNYSDTTYLTCKIDFSCINNDSQPATHAVYIGK